MPFASRRQQRFAFSTGKPWAKRWADETDFSKLPERKDSATTGMATPPTGDHALFNQSGIESRSNYRKRRKKLKAVCTCNTITTKASTGQPGEHISPGVTRIRGNLCNVHGKYGPCDGGSAKKPGKGKKPPKAKLTPAQRAQARDAEHATNRTTTLTQQGYSADDQTALEALRGGAQPVKVSEDLIDQGVVEQATDGSYRLTSSGRALMNAAGQGDAGRARDTVSGARDRLSARNARRQAAATRQQEVATRHAQTTANREQAAKLRAERAQAKKPAKAGGGGDKKKPSAAAAPSKAPARRRFARKPSTASLPSGGSSASAAKKPAKPMAEKPAKPRISAELSDAAQALSDGDDVSDEQLQQLITNGLVKLNRDGQPILTAAGMRATMKAQSDQDKAMFANMGGGGSGGGGKGGSGGSKLWPKGPSGKRTPQAAAAQSGAKKKKKKPSMSEMYDQIAHERERHRAREQKRNGPEDLNEKRSLAELRKEYPSFTIIKSSDGTPDRWLAITTTAYEDKDREIISTKAIARAVAQGDQTGNRGPLLYWHITGLELGDCDFQAQGGPGGRFLIEGGTFRSKAFADLGHKLSAAGYQMSPGFVHTDDQPQNGVYDTIRIYERSAVPQNRAANYFTRYATKEDKVITPEKAQEYREKAAGNPEALALLDTLLATTAKDDATAQARNVVFKEASALPNEIEIGGVVYTIKAMAPASMEQAADTEMADAETEQMDDGGDMEPDGDEGMDDAAFAQMIAQAVIQAITPLLDIEKKMAGHLADLKSTMGGYMQQKDDAQAAATSATATQIATLEAKLKELTGDLPSSVMSGAANFYRPSQSPLTKLTEGAAAVVKEQISQVPAGLSDPNEIAAYQLIFGNS